MRKLRQEMKASWLDDAEMNLSTSLPQHHRYRVFPEAGRHRTQKSMLGVFNHATFLSPTRGRGQCSRHCLEPVLSIQTSQSSLDQKLGHGCHSVLRCQALGLASMRQNRTCPTPLPVARHLFLPAPSWEFLDEL